MKKREWVPAVFFIVLGIHCFVMPGFVLTGSLNVHSYLAQVLHICFWIGIPIFFTGVIYLIWKKRKRSKGETS